MKDFVATRPRRPRSGRVVAGVAAGIGRRYGIDPVIVRVALVVSAVYGGAGLLGYLLGWLLLTQDGDSASPLEALLGRGHSSTSKPLTIVLTIALIPSASFVFGGYFSTAAGLIVLGAALFLLHRYRADQGQIIPPGAMADTPVSADPEAATMTDSMPTSRFGSTGTPTDPTGLQDAVPDQPPAWDPLGAAPFAWDLPEPSPASTPPPPLPRQRGPRVALATLGMLFVTGAVLGVLASSQPWLTPAHIAGVLAAIAGTGLVGGAFVHAGRGLIPLALLLSVVAFGVTKTHLDNWHGAGKNTYAPITVEDVRPVYQNSVGHTVLDLSGLPNTGSVTTTVELSAGELTVLVPPDAAVHATCSNTAGDIDCLGIEQHGANTPTVTANQAAANGDTLTIDVTARGGLGKVEVSTK